MSFGFNFGNNAGGNKPNNLQNSSNPTNPLTSQNQSNPQNANNKSGYSEDYNKDVKLDPSITLADSISSLKWMNSGNENHQPIFAGTGWDKSLRIFEVGQNHMGYAIMQKLMINLPQAATCLTWNQDNTCIYAGCVDGIIRAVDMNTMNITQVGKHTQAISSLHYIPGQNVLISTGYEKNVNFWQGSPNPVMQVPVDNKIFVTDFSNNLLAGGTANQKIFFIDMAMIGSGNKTIIDSVDLGKFSQIQSICLDKKGQSIGLTTVDGRSNISSIARGNNTFKTHPIITFKSNKVQEGGNVFLYPTNASCFNTVLECWFLTGGSDGTMSFWDYKARNKIKSFSFHNPICDAKVSPSGNMIAYSLGNDWHIGQQGIGKWPNLLGVHFVTQQQQKFQGVAGNKK